MKTTGCTKSFRQYVMVFIVLLGELVFSSANAQATSSTSSFTSAQQQEMQSAIHAYIVNHPEVLIEAGQTLQQKQMAAMQDQIKQAVEANKSALLSSKLSPLIGNANAPVTVIEFLDYQCGHCKNMNEPIKQLIAQNPNVRFIFKELPIFGEFSTLAARAALAASQQGQFLPMHEALLKEPTPFSEEKIMQLAKSLNLDMKKFSSTMNSAAITDEINTNLSVAAKLGVRGTPTFIILNSKMSDKQMTINEIAVVPGEINQSDFQKTINQMLGDG